MSILNKISTRKIGSLFCAIIIFINCFAVSVSASEQTGATLAVASTAAENGDTVSVSLDLKDNSGLWGLKFKVGYDHSVLTLTSVENGEVFADEDVMLPSSLDKEEFIYLAYLNRLQNNTANGTVVTLNFTISEDAEFKPYLITLTVDQAIDVDGEDVELTAKDGAISVVRCIHVMSSVWEYDEDVHWHNCALDDCGEIIDSTIAEHQIVDVPAVKATCTKNGLTKGKACSVCGYVLEKQQVVKASAHTPVVLPAVKATTERTGLTAGKKCKTCGTILVAQKTIPKIPYKMTKSAKTTGKMKMYEKKSTSSKVIKTIKKGVKVTIVDISGSWYKIKYNGKLGYIKSTSVTWKGKVKVAENNLRLRAGAGKKYKTLTAFPSGTEVTVVAATSNGWYKVRVKNGRDALVGYMSAKYIK